MAAGPSPLFYREYDSDDQEESLMRMTADMAQGIGNSMFMKMTHAEAEQMIMNMTHQFLDEHDIPHIRDPIDEFKNRRSIIELIIEEVDTSEYLNHLICFTPNTYGSWSMLEWEQIKVEMFSIDQVLHTWPERLEDLMKEQMLNALINRRIDNG
jgi:hypothetical protein